MNKNIVLILIAVTVLIISAVLLVQEITITQNGVVYALPIHTAAYEANLVMTPFYMGNYRLQQPDNLVPFNHNGTIQRGDLEYRHFNQDKRGFFTTNGRIVGFYINNPEYVFLNAISLGTHSSEVEHIIGQPVDIYYEDGQMLASYEKDNLIIEYDDFKVSAIIIHQAFDSIADYLDFFYTIQTVDRVLKDSISLEARNIRNPGELPLPALQYDHAQKTDYISIATEPGLFNSIEISLQKNNKNYTFTRDIQPGFSSMVFATPDSSEHRMTISLKRIVGESLSFAIEY